MKKFLTVIILAAMALPVFAKPGTIVTYTIDPEKNAYDHNNKGLMYLEEKCYYAAIQEFKIAISLNPRTQATAIYFNNLGKTYLIIGYPDLALDCFENAITQYSLNFEFYVNLAKCYQQLGLTQDKLVQYRTESAKNPILKVMVALLEEQSGNKKKAITVLDDFAMSEPDLIITPAVKNHISKLIEEIRQ